MLALFGLGFAEILGLAGFLIPTLTIGQVFPILLFAAMAVHRSQEPATKMTDLISWSFLFIAAIILAIGSRTVGMAGLIKQILPMLPMLAGLAALVHVTRNKGDHFARILSSLISSGCLVFGAIVAWTLLNGAIYFLPNVYDPVLYRIDAILRLNEAYRLADLMKAHLKLRSIILWIYEFNLVFAIPAVLSECFYSRKISAELNLQLLISSFLVFPLFCLMPALAPAFFFGSAFPDLLPLTASMPPHVVVTQIETIRNTFPSLHATWAILILLSLRDSPLMHLQAGFLYLLATFVATLGFGEHYAVDWVAACPLALIVRAVCCTSLPWPALDRWLPLATGAGMLVSWVIVVRGAPVTLTGVCLVRVLALASVGLFIVLEARLSHAERGATKVLKDRTNDQ